MAQTVNFEENFVENFEENFVENSARWRDLENFVKPD